MEKNGCKNIVIMAGIWVFLPFFLMWTVIIASGENHVVLFFINFFIGNLVIFGTATYISGIQFFKYLIDFILDPFSRKPSKFKKNTDTDPITSSYGSVAIPLSTIIFIITGIIATLISGNGFFNTRITLAYLIIGIVWGFFVYYIFQKGYFRHDDF